MLLLRPSLQQSGPFVHPPCSELLYLCGGMQPELLSTLRHVGEGPSN